MNRAFKIFVDFDGTITTRDVGEALFEKFGTPEKVEPLINQLLTDEISSRDCWTELCNSVENISETELNSFINTISIDKSFSIFNNYCRMNDFQLYVLSDGFDYYIERIFSQENLSNIKYFANKL